MIAPSLRFGFIPHTVLARRENYNTVDQMDCQGKIADAHPNSDSALRNFHNN